MSEPNLTPSNKKLFLVIRVICDLSIIAPNETYVKYYPSGAISLSRPHLFFVLLVVNKPKNCYLCIYIVRRVLRGLFVP